MVYLPQLNYKLQMIGSDDPRISKDLKEIDDLCKDLIGFYEKHDIQVVILSEYGIAPANKPVALNRTLRKHGYITVREEMGGRSEEHTSELQSRGHLVCRLL